MMSRATAGSSRYGILGVDPALDGVAAQPAPVALEADRLARRHPDLLLHQVEAGDHLGHRVLHLDPGVHLHEVERCRRCRAGTRSCRRRRSRCSTPARPPPRPSARAARASSAGLGLSSISFWWRRCTEQSRSPRWTTLPKLSPMTWISTCRGCSRYFSTYTAPLPNAASASFCARPNELGELLGVLRDPHPLPAAARRRLDDHREADRLARRPAPRPRPRSCRASRARSARRPPRPAGARWPCRPSGGSGRRWGR